jgi:hypothetical protein
MTRSLCWTVDVEYTQCYHKEVESRRWRCPVHVHSVKVSGGAEPDAMSSTTQILRLDSEPQSRLIHHVTPYCLCQKIQLFILIIVSNIIVRKMSQ